MATTGAPRPDHIAELTRGVGLPLNPIKSLHLGVILEVMSQAWSELCSEGVSALQSGTEPEVTALLGPRLNHLRESTSNKLKPWRDLVSGISRGSEAVNFDGRRLEKAPDLNLLLTDRNANFPLVVECKIIDHPNDKTIGMYCKHGIARFISGDYAWMNREAIMLAYIRDGATVGSKLTPHLQAQSGKKLDPFLTVAGPEQVPSIHSTALRSMHQRTFQYLDVVDGIDPGPISLWHLWLAV